MARHKPKPSPGDFLFRTLIRLAVSALAVSVNPGGGPIREVSYTRENEVWENAFFAKHIKPLCLRVGIPEGSHSGSLVLIPIPVSDTRLEKRKQETPRALEVAKKEHFQRGLQPLFSAEPNLAGPIL